MSISYPRTDILTGLTFVGSTPAFTPLWRQEHSRTANGVTLTKDIGPMLWRATYNTTALTKDQAAEVEADLLSLGNGLNLFEGYDPRKPFPASDATSALTGVTVDSVKSDRTEIRLTGLPANFVLTKGDWISVDDGTNLHLLKVLETTTASGSGRSPMFAVQPPVRASISAADPVTLRYASARFMLEDVTRTPIGANSETITFTALQVIE